MSPSQADASAAMQSLARHPLFKELAAQGGIGVHVYPPLHISPHPQAIRGRACAFGAQAGTICVCHPHLHRPIIGTHDDLVEQGVLDPEYGIEPSRANTTISKTEIAPPLKSGGEEVKAGQGLSVIAEDSEDGAAVADRRRVIAHMEQQIESLLDTAAALAMARGAEDVAVEDCVQLATRLSFAVSREAAAAGASERAVLDELARPLRLVDMGHVAVNSLNFVEVMYLLGTFHTRRGDLLRSHMCLDTAIFSRRNATSSERRSLLRQGPSTPIPGVQISAVLSAVWGYQRAFMLLLDGHPTAAVQACELAEKTARHVLALVKASPPTEPPPWVFDRAQVEQLVLHGSATTAMCFVCLGDFQGAKRHCARVLKEIPPCGQAQLLENRPLLRIIQIFSVASVCIRHQKAARKRIKNFTKTASQPRHNESSHQASATNQLPTSAEDGREGDTQSYSTAIFGSKSIGDLLDEHARWEERVSKALLGIRYVG